MNPRREGGGGREESVSSTLVPSPRVLLEVAFLDGDRAAAAVPAALDEQMGRTVLVVAAEADLRRYVRECLRERTDLRMVEAATITAAVALAASYPPELLVVDEPERDVLIRLPRLRAVVIVDEVPRGASASGTRVRLLGRPFTAEGLVHEVCELLGLAN
jgi:hypothetical protein